MKVRVNNQSFERQQAHNHINTYFFVDLRTRTVFFFEKKCQLYLEKTLSIYELNFFLYTYLVSPFYFFVIKIITYKSSERFFLNGHRILTESFRNGLKKKMSIAHTLVFKKMGICKGINSAISKYRQYLHQERPFPHFRSQMLSRQQYLFQFATYCFYSRSMVIVGVSISWNEILLGSRANMII